MKNRFTPGPWRYAPTNTETVSHLVRCSEGYAVADVTHWFDLPVDANARLIAAAPTMLEALMRIAEASDHYSNEADAGNKGADTLAYAHKSTCNLARAAIAKATGGASHGE